MNIPNRIQIDDLSAMEVADIASLPVEQLTALQSEIAERLTLTKLMKDRFDSALECRFSLPAREGRAALGKDTGTVRFNEGPAQIVADLPKKVSWDQSQARSLQGLPADLHSCCLVQWASSPIPARALI